MEETTIDPEALLQHRGFLLRLARSLTRDEPSAEDLVQATWISALRRPPRHARGLRAWLGTIARRLASTEARAAWRREERERRVARPEALETGPTVDGTLELQRDIVDALRRLREPYRRTLYLRYYHDLSPGEIARREELALSTVKSRLARGLAELREELDRRHSDERALWLTPLASFLDRTTEAKGVAVPLAGSLGGILTVQKLALVAVVFAIAGGAWLAVDRGRARGGEREGGRPDRTTLAVEARDAVEEIAPAVDLSAPVRSEVDLEDARTSNRGTSPAVVTGRLVFESGAPAARVEVTVLRGFRRDPSDAARPRHLDPPPPARTDLDGEFEFRMDLEKSIWLILEAHVPGFVPVLWTDRTLEPEGRLVLETKTVAAGGNLLVELGDSEGKRVGGTWEAWFTPIDFEDPDWGGRSTVEELDPSTGSRLLEDLPVGRARVHVSCPLTRRRLLQVVEIRAGTVTQVHFTFDGPPLDRRLVIDPRLDPEVTRTSVSRGAWRLQRPGEAPREARPPGPFDGDRDPVYEDLPSGPYTLECLDPRFEPWRLEGIEPGRVVRPKLRGRSSVKLRVLGTNGEEVNNYSLVATERGSDGRTRRTVLREEDEEQPEDGIYRGFVPTDICANTPEEVLPGAARTESWTLEVEAPGYATAIVTLDDLPPDEVTPVTVQLGTGTSIAGLVREADGELPNGEVQVILTAGSLPAVSAHPSQGHWRGQVIPQPKTSASLDDRGEFRFDRIRSGEWTLRVVRGGWVAVDRTIVVTDGEEADLELVLPGTAELIVRTIVPVAADLSGMALRLNTLNDPTVVPWQDDSEARESPLRRDVPCRFDSLPPGEYDLELLATFTYFDGAKIGGNSTDLQRIHLTADARRELTVDLTESMPGGLGVRVRLDDEPCFDVFTAPHPLDESSLPGATRDGNVVTLTSDTGEDHPFPVTPGRYTIDVYARDGSWGYAAPNPVDIRPGELRIVELELRRIEGTVRFVDEETGEPLADQEVEWFLGKPDFTLSTLLREFRTDPDGRLSMSFPEGELGLQVASHEPARIHWPPRSELELRLRAVE